jgi:hypothetical protein
MIDDCMTFLFEVVWLTTVLEISVGTCSNLKVLQMDRIYEVNLAKTEWGIIL